MATDNPGHSPHPSIYEMGRNLQAIPVLGASCSCGWRHFTAYGDGGSTAAQADEYLRRRFDDHLEA